MKQKICPILLLVLLFSPILRAPIFAEESEDWFLKGNELRKQGRLQEAVNAYQSAVKANPEIWSAHYNLGLVYQKLKQYKQAVAAYERALRLAPDNPDIHVSLGNVHNFLENWEDAIAHLNIAVRAQPDDPAAHGGLGWAYYNYKSGPPFKFLVVINLNKAVELFERQNMWEAAEATRNTLKEALRKFGANSPGD